MRARMSLVACLAAVTATVFPVASANAAADPEVPQVPSLEVLGLDGPVTDGPVGGDGPRARSQTDSLRMRMPLNLARLLAVAATSQRGGPAQVRRELRTELRQEGLGEYVHVGPLRGRRFTVTAISDQACATVRAHRRGSVESGPCTPADVRASMTPLQDSANLLLDLYRDAFEYGRRASVLRELYHPMFLRWISRVVAPQGVQVSGVVDTDRDRLDDDARLAFHANHTSVCATLPVSREGAGRVTFGSCQRLTPRRVHIHESARAVFLEMKRGADIGASFDSGTLERRARNAAELARAFSSHPEARARAEGDHVQFRARVNNRVRFACYRVSPDGHRATYSRSGRPGTWRLGHCR
jgi:hypothetical protein